MIMIDPVSLSASTIAVLIATKAFEKTGEKLSESTWNLIGGFLTSLNRKDPTTANAIERVASQPTLADQQPEIFGASVLIEKVQEAASENLELQQAIQAIAEAFQSQPNAVVNMTKLAEKIGVVVQGGSPHITITNF
jgi:Tfp pilus assembly protein PilN